jgi:hypothetical protein
MKYLNYRNQFLNDNKQLSKDINSSKMINEVLENQLKWGDSLLGRLINSTIRVLKIGYGVSRVPNLLKEFEASLSELITDSMTEDMSEKFNTLAIKALFEEMKDVCLSSQNDEQKLGILIGWNGTTEMFDPQDPNANIPGQYDGRTRRILATPSLVQRLIDVITNDLPNLEKFMGEDRNTLLDNLSDFADELRKLTLPVGITPGGGGAARQPFHLRLSRVLNSLTQVNASFKFLSYWDFINEEKGGEKFAAMGDDQFEDWIKANPGAEQKARKLRAEAKGEKYEEPKADEIKAEEPKGEQKPSTGLAVVPKPQSTAVGPVDKTQQNQKPSEKKPEAPVSDSSENQPKPSATTPDSEKTEEQPKEEQPKEGDSTSSLKRLKEIAIELLPKIKEQEEEAIRKMELYGELLKCFGGLGEQDRGKIKELSVEEENGEKTDLLSSLENIKDEEPFISSQESKKPEPDSKTAPDQVKTVSTKEKQPEEATVESKSLYKSYINMILEEQNPPPAPAPGAPAGPTKPSVQDIWTSAWGEFDRQLQGTRVSQREADELEELIQNGADQLTIDFTMRPDPLVRIIRIFKKAHNLYYTPIIPSGRMNNEVSSKTYREYSYVGTGTPGMPSSPGYGPWINNLIFEKWSDGVMKILQDQQYRKVLANMNFIVPGSADMFNKGASAAKESIKITSKIYQMILEAETRTAGESSDEAKKKKSQGQILMDFINDMLDKQIQGDFEGARKKLLKKYFGVEVGDDKLKITENTPPPPLNQRDVEENSYIYKAFTDDKFKDTDCGQFFAFPIEDQRKNKGNGSYEMIFIQPIRIEGNKVEVKFTFDNQSCINKYIQDKNSSAKKIDWSTKSQLSPFAYYGVMKNNNLTQGFKICYININDSSQANWNAGDIYAEPSSPGQSVFKIDTGDKKLVSGTVAVRSSRLVYYDNAKQEKVSKGDFDKHKIHNEKTSDDIKADLEKGGVKLYEALLAEGRKPEFGFWT